MEADSTSRIIERSHWRSSWNPGTESGGLDLYLPLHPQRFRSIRSSQLLVAVPFLVLVLQC